MLLISWQFYNLFKMIEAQWILLIDCSLNVVEFFFLFLYFFKIIFMNKIVQKNVSGSYGEWLQYYGYYYFLSFNVSQKRSHTRARTFAHESAYICARTHECARTHTHKLTHACAHWDKYVQNWLPHDLWNYIQMYISNS